MLLHAQSADDAPPVQQAVVVAEFVDQVCLLVGEVALEEQLPGEEVVAREGADLAWSTRLRVAEGLLHHSITGVIADSDLHPSCLFTIVSLIRERRSSPCGLCPGADFTSCFHPAVIPIPP